MTRTSPKFATANQQALYRHGYLLSGGVEQAQDLTQATLLELYKAWPRVRTAAFPKAYAHKVLVRTYLSGQRRFRRDRELVTLADSAPVMEQPELRVTVLQAVASLPPRGPVHADDDTGAQFATLEMRLPEHILEINFFTKPVSATVPLTNEEILQLAAAAQFGELLQEFVGHPQWTDNARYVRGTP